MRRYAILLMLLLPFAAASAQSKHSKTSAFKSYKGLVMAGYQGWFNAQGDGGSRGWNHYRAGRSFEPGNIKIDLWPDVTEYAKTYETPFKLADGSAARLFSSRDESTTDLHFKWMQQYGVDGVFVQRFISDIKGKAGLAANNKVLNNILAAAPKYHRAISVMYDMSGMNDADGELLMNDWKYLVDSLKLTGRGNKQSYLYHNGKPLIALWGVGFPDRNYSLQTIEHLVDFFKNDPVYGGCAILLGLPTYWRELRQDTDTDPHLLDVIRKTDIVHPWFVGRYNEEGYPRFSARIAEDIAWCKANRIDYVPTVFPGFSWHNMYNKSPQNQIPRNHGQFFWKQLTTCISSGAEMLYIAMFDEVDEGTAIFKSSKNPPVGLSTFVSIDSDIPSDYYLFLTGKAGQILRKQIPMPASIPLPKNAQSSF